MNHHAPIGPLRALPLLLAATLHAATPEVEFEGQPLEVRRLFAPAPGEQEWSDKVFLATAVSAGPWTARVHGATAGHTAPGVSVTRGNEAWEAAGRSHGRMGFDHPEGLVLLIVQPPEVPAPKGALEFAAVDETDADRTARLQSLLDAAGASGTVTIAPGEHRIGTVFLRPGVRLHLSRGARLVASHDDALFPELPDFGGMKHALIVANEAHGASITGTGTIDGQGHRLRRNQQERRHPGTRLIAVRNTNDLVIEDVTLLDSFAWAGHFQDCERLTVRRVAVVNEINRPGWHPKGAHVVWNNADGLNPDGCRNVVFEDLLIHAGDDCVAIKSMDPELSASDITVRRCVLWTPVAALKVGTESRGESMSGLHFEQIHIPRCGRALALDIFDRALASGITFRDITVGRADQGLLFRAGRREAAQQTSGSLDRVVLENIQFLAALPPSAFETPHSEARIGRVEVKGWTGPDGPADSVEAARMLGSERVEDLVFHQ